MTRTRIKTAPRKKTLPQVKLRQVVAAVYAKKDSEFRVAATPIIVVKKAKATKKLATA